MKTLARVGAAASFTVFFFAGMSLLAMSGLSFSPEHIILTILGLFFIGTAFFTGSIISLVGEKCGSKQDRN